MLLLSGCASVARVDLTDPPCDAAFREQLASILVEEGETPSDAGGIAHRAALDVSDGDAGVRPFSVVSRAADYTFFVQKKKTGCLLRLVSRRKGFTVYTNDVTYIASRPLGGCRCATE